MVSLLRIDSLVPMGLVIELLVVMSEYLMNADKHRDKTEQDKKGINPNWSQAHYAHDLNEDKKERQGDSKLKGTRGKKLRVTNFPHAKRIHCYDKDQGA